MRSFFLCLAILVSQLAPAPAQSRNAAPASLPKLKPFELHTIDGTQTVTLQKLAGKVVVLDFFFPTCEECVLEMPRLCALDKKYRSDKFVMYLVNIVPDQDPRVAAMFHKAGCTLPVLHTDDMPWAIHWIGRENWGPYGAPETLLIDANGTIVSHLHFNTAKHRAQADQKITSLIQSGGRADHNPNGH